jgi:hypothetical protein
VAARDVEPVRGVEPSRLEYRDVRPSAPSFTADNCDTYTHTSTHTHTHAYGYIDMYTNTHAYMDIQTCIHTHMHICGYMDMYLHTYIWIVASNSSTT